MIQSINFFFLLGCFSLHIQQLFDEDKNENVTLPLTCASGEFNQQIV